MLEPADRIPRAARVAVSVYFAATGFLGGVWVTRIPAVKQQTHLTDGLLGLALFAGPVGLIIGATFAGRLADRLGSARIARAGGIGCSGMIVTPGLAHNLAELMAALLVACMFTAMLDVGENTQGAKVETAYGRPVFTSFHACYSLGGISGALIGGAFAWTGVGLAPSLAAAGVPGAIVLGIAGRWLLPDDHGADKAATARSSPAGGEPTRGAGSGSVRRLVLTLGLMAVCGLVGEGAAADWSGVYLRDNLGTSAGFAALGYTAFSVGMAAGRLAGDWLAARLGPVRLVRACGLFAAVGMAGGLLSRNAFGGLAGFALLGAGLSCVLPQVFAAGARADPVRPGAGMAWVVGLGYTGMTGGPVVIGAVASVIGLQLALGIPVLLALWIAIAARILGLPGLAVSDGVASDAREAAAAMDGQAEQ